MINIRKLKTYDEFDILKFEPIYNIEKEYGCKEIGQNIYHHVNYIINMKLVKTSFNNDEIKQISLYLGDTKYMYRLSNNFEFTKKIKIGFFNIINLNIKCTKYINYNDETNHFIIEINCENENKFYDCINLTSVFKKIKDIKNYYSNLNNF